jgi:CRP/FNR family cyclic AMP-dependent transcriptional regulator
VTTSTTSGLKREAIQVLRADPELSSGIPADERKRAEAECIAPTVRLEAGPWMAPAPAKDSGNFGLLVVDGFMARQVGPEGRSSAELVGPGDLLRPWSGYDEFAKRQLELEPRWTVITETRVAILGAAFARRAARYPPLVANLIDRGLERARQLSVESAIVHQRPIELRLRLLFLHLAHRWGRVSPDGVRLQLPLTHSLIADLLAARRPTITSALHVLGADRLLTRTDEGWLLEGALADQVRDGDGAASALQATGAGPRPTPFSPNRRLPAGLA